MRKEAVMQPRVISVTGFQNVFDLALLNSCLRRRQDDTDVEIQKLKEEIALLKERDQELQNNIDANEFAAS